MNRNAVPVFKKRTGTPFRCVPVQFEPWLYSVNWLWVFDGRPTYRPLGVTMSVFDGRPTYRPLGVTMYCCSYDVADADDHVVKPFNYI